MSDEEKEAIEYIKAFQKDLYGAIEKNLMAIYIDRVWNCIDKLQKELEEKTTILMAGADKVKQLEKENAELKEKLDYYKQKENQDFEERDYYEE